MSTDPFRTATRVSAPVAYRERTGRGCIPLALIGLACGGGFVGLGHGLGWVDKPHGGAIYGGGFAIALVVFVIAAIVHYKLSPVLKGTLTLEGTRLSGPDAESVVDFMELHDIVIHADDHQADLRLTIPGKGFAHMAPDEVGRVLNKNLSFAMAFHVKGVSAADLRDRFQLPAYVEALDPDNVGGMVLDRQDPLQQPLIDPLLGAMARCREQNLRYQAFAALPWDQPVAPTTPLLKDIALEPGTDPRTFFTQLAQSPAGADPANPLAVIARAYLDVRLWLDGRVGVTPDYLLVDAFGGLEERQDHSYTLIPMGAGRSSVRRDNHVVSTGGETAARSYPALVVEAPALGEPLWAIFPGEPWDNADNQLDAAVAFAGRG